jgi:YfiH family protein
MAPGWLVPDWPAPPTVRALSTWRAGGSSRDPYASLNLGDHVGDAPMAVTKNRRLLKEAAGLPGEPSWLTQVHGTQVVELDTAAVATAERGRADSGTPGAVGTPGAHTVGALVGDAAVTGRPGAVCAVLTADCLPVLLAAGSGDRVGAAHAGWRGLAAGVIESTVAAMRAPPAEMLAWLGPAIGPGHFEVGPEVRDEFLRMDAGAEAAFRPSPGGRYMADLFVLARRRLAQAGVVRVYGGGVCTHAQVDKYFSHRRDGRTGRQATLIWLG